MKYEVSLIKYYNTYVEAESEDEAVEKAEEKALSKGIFDWDEVEVWEA